MEGNRRKHLCRLPECAGCFPKLGTECRALPKPYRPTLSGCRYWHRPQFHENILLGAAFSSAMERRLGPRAKVAADAEGKERKGNLIERRYTNVCSAANYS